MLKLKSLVKKFDNQSLCLKNISKAFDRSVVHGIYGFNGSGKSTLIKLIASIFTPDSGEIFFNDEKITHIKNYLHKVCYINSETRNLYERLTGKQNISFLNQIYKNSSSPDTLSLMLGELNLLADLNKYVSSYSLGMKQKLSIAIHLSQNSEIILLDEFTDHLDDNAISFLVKYIHGLKENKTILYVSRTEKNILEFCDKKYRLFEGQLYE